VKNPWLGAVLAALIVTAGTAVVLVLVRAPAVEIVKTSGVAGGAVVALYALWLNDRRRRTEEKRHDLESEKVADERFARSVELLGNEADQVRVGAMHALSWLAKSTPRYRQTVIDVLCAYLRRPFHHPSWDLDAADPDTRFLDAKPSQEEQQEQQVRRTAQRLIRDLLSWGDHQQPHEHYDLDLTGAALEYFQLDGRHINRFTARRAQFYGITTLPRMHVQKPTLFSGAIFHGRLNIAETRFDGGLAFTEATFKRRVDFNGTKIGTFLALTDPAPAEVIGELEALPGCEMRTLHAGWPLTGSPQPARPRLENHVQQNSGGGADRVAGDDHGLSDRYVAAEPGEAGTALLGRERLGDESNPETEPDEVKK
jgi:hypothetical protein